MMSGLVPTTVTRGAIAWCALLLVVLISPLAACADSAATATPAPTPMLTSPTAPAPSPTPGPAVCQIAWLKASSAEIKPGEEIVITAKVINTGDAEGTYTAELGIDNITEVVKEVTLPAGGTQIVRFLVSRVAPGAYKVTLGELSGQFVVTEPVILPEPDNPEPTVPNNSSVPPCCR